MQTTECVPETPTSVPTLEPGVTPTPVTPEPIPTSDCFVPEQNVQIPDSVETTSMPVHGSRQSDVDYGPIGDFFGWLGDTMNDLVDWLFAANDFANVVVVYLAIISLVFMRLYFQKTRQYAIALRDVSVLYNIDPDVVRVARFELMEPEAKGRVVINPPDPALKPESV